MFFRYSAVSFSITSLIFIRLERLVGSMEKEVTVLEQFSMICDVLYKIIWIGLIVLNAFYVVGNLAVGWIIIAALGCCILKTIVGLFNYCLIVDIIHYYCDLSIGLIAVGV